MSNLDVVNFRNYDKAKINFFQNLNILYGLNAQGKTNFLEAIYLLCLGRSFRLAKNKELVRSGTDFFKVEGKVVQDNHLEKKIVLKYVLNGRKETSLDRKRLKGHSEIFGQFPIVVMAPDEFKITEGGPAERRRFLDILLSQVSLSYLITLQEYNRTLKQRNKILQDLRDGKIIQESAMIPWTEKLIKNGCKIIKLRKKFIEEFAVILNSIYKQYSESKDNLNVYLDASIALTNLDLLEENFSKKLMALKAQEKRIGSTLVGPHRDELIFEINGFDLRKYGSRGEHKSVLISIKIAEFKYLNQCKDETPILLLDDCYSELDKFREERVFDSMQGLGQTFLTTPKESALTEHRDLVDRFGSVSTFRVNSGQIERLS